MLNRRQTLAAQAEAEFEQLGKKGFPGREFIDVMTVRQALAMRDQKGMQADEIEERLNLKPGLMAKLGDRGIVSEAGDNMDGKSEGGAGFG